MIKTEVSLHFLVLYSLKQEMSINFVPKNL